MRIFYGILEFSIFICLLGCFSFLKIEDENEIKITISQGNKLFGDNEPFIINISSPDTDNKKSDVDLICVIDVSGSMNGKKIEFVKKSLKVLVNIMDKNDRLSLIIFNQRAKKLLDLEYLTKENKEILFNTIESINAGGGTSILSGLEIAIDILKTEELSNKLMDKKKSSKVYKERVSSVILLSDGNDNNLNEIELAEGLKKLTKGTKLSFTLHTFGYGLDHDPKVMTKLANIRDGSFYLVEKLDNVKNYFINVLGACMSIISERVELFVSLINEKCSLKKVFGLENFYSYNLDLKHFSTTILQLISGKEYTYVIEIQCNSDIQKNEDILEVSLKYENLINENEIEQKKFIHKYCPVETSYSRNEKISPSNEEYIRSKTYDVMNEAMELSEKEDKEKARSSLATMKNWLESNYNGNNRSYLEDINHSIELVNKTEDFVRAGKFFMAARISEGQMKRGGARLDYSNSLQTNLIQKANIGQTIKT